MTRVWFAGLLALAAFADVEVRTTSLPGGVVGQPYTATLQAADGRTPYTWSRASGTIPPGIALSATGVLSGTPTNAGTFTFRVEVRDAGGDTDRSGQLTIAVVQPLAVTTATLPPATAGTQYNANLAASGGNTPYSWAVTAGALPAGVTLSTGGALSGTPPAAGSFNITVRVTDAQSRTATRDLTLAVNPAPLTVTTSSLPDAAIGAPYSQAVAASGGSPPYTWSLTGSLPAGLTLFPAGAISGTPSAPGSANFTLRVTDSQARTATRNLTIVVTGTALSVATSSLPDAPIQEAYSQTLTANGGTAPYAWAVVTGLAPPGLSLSGGGVLSGAPTQAGTFRFTVRVTDALSQNATRELTLNVTVPPLTVTTANLPDAQINQAYSQTLAASGGTPPYGWSVSGGQAPPGMTLSAAGVLSGTPAQSGRFTFTARVQDAEARAATREYTVTVAPPPLSITAAAVPEATSGQAYSLTFAATGGVPPYAWNVSAGQLPPGLTLAESGALTGTPSAAGSYNFTVRVTDAQPRSVTRDVTLVVQPAPLSVTTSSLAGGDVGQAYSQTLAATGGTPPYTWALAGGALPAGLTLAANGGIAGTPSEAGTATFTVRVSDAQARTATRELTLAVNPAALAITTALLPGGTTTQPYFAALAATGGTPPYTWSVGSGTLPTGLTLDPTGALSGTPSAASNAAITLRATDAAGRTATREYTLNIRAAAPTITTTSLPPATTGVAYSVLLTATGGQPPLVWSVAAGQLPPGIQLSGATLDGAPSTPGEYVFTIGIADAAGAEARRQLTLNVIAALSITTGAALPQAAIGSPYRQTLEAAGGRSPYRWQVTAGELPNGLGLSGEGVIAGSPSRAGAFSFTVETTDAGGAKASRVFTINVAPPLSLSSDRVLPEGSVGVAYAAALQATGGRTPYRWSIASGALPAGLNLNATTGAVTGTPTAAGAAEFSARVEDAAGAAVTGAYTLRVAEGLTIVTAPALPNAAAGVAYSQTLAAAGGAPPYRWSFAGPAPAGLSLSPEGVLSGTPSAAAALAFAAEVTDNRGARSRKDFTLRVESGFAILTATLPDAVAGRLYEQSLEVRPGTPPYRWTVDAGALPQGLSLDAAGAIRGAPVQAGSYSFTLRAADAAGAAAARTFALNVQLPSLPGMSLSGLPAVIAAATQPPFDLTLEAPYPADLAGQVRLDFAGEGGAGDPAVQFATGGRVATFLIPAGSTRAVFPSPAMAVQTGTTAGRLTFFVAMQSAGRPVVVETEMAAVNVPATAPVIRNARLARTADGFEVRLTAFSPTRELRDVKLRFTPSSEGALQTAEFTIPLAEIARQWYGGAASAQFGTLLTVTVPFRVQGAAEAVAGVAVTLSNGLGESAASNGGW